MSEYLKFYKGDVTAGRKDGVEISSGDLSNPITFDLNLTAEQKGYAKLAVRCEPGYAVDGDVEIGIKYRTEDTSDEITAMLNHYKVCIDEGYDTTTVPGATFTDSIALSGVDDTNKLFWVMCTSSSDEKPTVDKNCILHAQAMIKAKTTEDSSSDTSDSGTSDSGSTETPKA